MKKLLIILASFIYYSEAIRFRPPRYEPDEDKKPELTENEKADIEIEKIIQKRKDYWAQKHKEEDQIEADKELK